VDQIVQNPFSPFKKLAFLVRMLYVLLQEDVNI